MSFILFAKEYHERMFPGYKSNFQCTDSELIEQFDYFAFDEDINQVECNPLFQQKKLGNILDENGDGGRVGNVITYIQDAHELASHLKKEKTTWLKI